MTIQSSSGLLWNQKSVPENLCQLSKRKLLLFQCKTFRRHLHVDSLKLQLSQVLNQTSQRCIIKVNEIFLIFLSRHVISSYLCPDTKTGFSLADYLTRRKEFQFSHKYYLDSNMPTVAVCDIYISGLVQFVRSCVPSMSQVIAATTTVRWLFHQRHWV